MNSPTPPPIQEFPAAASTPPPVYYTTAPAKPTSSTAIVSLVSGLLSWLLLPWLGALVAIISGHMARGEIRRSNGQMEGDGMAVAGLVLGYLQIGLTLAFVLLLFMFFGGLAAIAAFTN